MFSCRVQAPADRRRGPGRAGFTLIEVLVAMVIAGLLTGVIFQLMQGQAKFVEMQSGRQEVQQNARGTLELISSELRAVPPGAIIDAQASRLEYRLPRVWGITCSQMIGGSGAVWVLFPAGALPSDFPANPETAEDWGFAVPAASGDGWRFLAIASTLTGDPACDPSFNMNGLENYQAVRLGYNGLGNARGLEARVFIWQKVIYESGTGSSSSRTWVKRNNGASDPQVMAGPLSGTDGLVFGYWCENTRVTPPVSSGMLPKLTAVQVQVTMESTRGSNAGRQIERDSTRVALRNSPGGGAC